MKFSQIFKRTKTTHPVVIFDIGSASIGGAVVFFDKEVPRITYSTRVQLPFQEVADEKRLLPQIEEILTQVASDVQKKGLLSKDKQSIIPQEIVCIFSSLWSNTESTKASFEHKERFIVTDSIMDNLLSQIHESKSNENKEEEVIIEEIVVSSLLNGYPTQSPLGKEAQNIEVTFLESTVTKELHTKIQGAIHKVFSPDISLLLRSFTLVAFSVTRDMFEDIKDFLLIDVTGEITDITVVKDSILGDTLSFPYGKNTIVRDIVKKNKSVPEDVMARIKIAFTDDESKMKGDIFEEEKQWTEMFGKACGELSSVSNPLPRDVFLIVDTDYKKWFSSMIERIDFRQFTATQEAFHVNYLIGEPADGVYVLENGAVLDNFIIIDSLFYNREYLARRS
jgi:hypothetical protein